MEIRGSKCSNTYQIVNEESSTINTPLGESFDLIHTFQLTKDLEEFVFFDVQVSKGTENLYEFVTAIKKCKCNTTFFADLESTGRKVKGIITESKANFEDYEKGGFQIREIYRPLELDWV